MLHPLLTAIVLLAPSVAPAATPPAAIGAPAPPFTLTDTRWLPRPATDLGVHAATVFVFVTNDCPIAARYLPRIAALETEYRARDVRFALVNVGAADSVVDAAASAVEHAIGFPVLKDFDGSAAAALGATRTPEAVVLDRERRIVYRGRIDDQYRLGCERAAAGRADLKEAIDDVLARRAVSVAETPVDGCRITPDVAIEPDPSLTWSKDVAPIVFANCVQCHQPKGEAPFSLLTFDDARAHADMIEEVVHQRRMPPWFGSSDTSEAFANHRRLDDADVRTIRAWVKSGAKPGDLAAAPAPPPLRTGDWKIGEPDLVVKQLIATHVPKDGVMPYQYVVLPHFFAHDTWVSAVEIKPETRSVLHHANLAFVKLTEKFDLKNFITGTVPGGDPMVLDAGTAVLIPAFSVLALECHYVTTGKATDDRISVGFRFPRERVDQRLYHAEATNWRFAIPPGAEAHEVAGNQRFEPEIEGVGVFAHMHLRGKDMTFVARAPDGSAETLLVVPNYSFDWQQSYRWATAGKTFPAGTTLEVVAHYDNSSFNPFNPDPTATVRPGLQTHDEMMYGFFFYRVKGERLGLTIDPADGSVAGAARGE